MVDDVKFSFIVMLTCDFQVSEHVNSVSTVAKPYLLQSKTILTKLIREQAALQGAENVM